MVSLGTGLLVNKFAFQMRYSEINSDGYIERTGSDHRSAYLSGVMRTSKSSLKANIILGEEHTGISWWGVPKEMLQTNRRYNPAGEYTDDFGNIRYYDNESDNYVQNHFQLIYSNHLNRDLYLHTAFHFTKGQGFYEEYREDQKFDDYGLSSIDINGININTTDLVRRKWMSNDFTGIVYSINYKKPDLEAIIGGGMNIYKGWHYGKLIWMRIAGYTEKDYQWYLNDARKTDISMYGKLNYEISDKISLFGDLQYRYIFYRMSGIDDDLKDLSQDHLFFFINPKAGLFFEINSNQETYLSFAVANREPTRSDFKEATGDPEATPDPETLFDLEAGYNLRTGKAAYGINLYNMIYKDQLVPTGELSDVGYPIMTNVKNSYRAGIEMIASMKPISFIDWNFNLTLSRNKILNFEEHYLDYNTSLTTSEYKSKNLGTVNIAYSPSISGSSDLTIGIAKNFKMHLIGKYVGKQYFDNTMSGVRMIDPYLVSNLRLDFYPVIRNTRKIEIQLLINNVLDRSYESNAYGGNWYEDGIENTWAYYFPQAGINFLIKLGIKI